MSTQKAVSDSHVVRQLGQRVKDIQALYQKLKELYLLLPVPTPKEFEEILAGRKPLTLEVLLLGVIHDAMFHLDEARDTIACFRPYSRGSLGKGAHRFWKKKLGEQIGWEVRRRACWLEEETE